MFETHLHPMIVHFPVALILTGFLFDAIGLFFCKEHKLSRIGFWLMIFGTLGAVSAFFTGEFFTNEMTGPLGELKEKHELFAKITMFTMIAASLLRLFLIYKKKITGSMKWLVFFLYFIAAASVAYTGFLGGTLVYNYMLGL